MVPVADVENSDFLIVLFHGWQFFEEIDHFDLWEYDAIFFFREEVIGFVGEFGEHVEVLFVEAFDDCGGIADILAFECGEYVFVFLLEFEILLVNAVGEVARDFFSGVYVGDVGAECFELVDVVLGVEHEFLVEYGLHI